MTTVTKHADSILDYFKHLEAADFLQKLSLDSQTKTLEVPEATKKPSSILHGSVDAGGAYGPIQMYDLSTTPQLQEFMDPTMCYLPNGYPSTPYYYGGYEGSTHEWDYFPGYINPDGVEMSPGVYGNNGSLMHNNGYGYEPYGAYLPAVSQVPTMGHDGQLYGPQHYQYPMHFYHSTTLPSGQYTPNQAPATVQAPSKVEVANGNANGVVNGNNDGSMPLKPSHLNSSLSSNGSYGRDVFPGSIRASGYQDTRFAFDGMWSPVPWLDGSSLSGEQPKPATSSFLSSTVSYTNNIQHGRDQNPRPFQNSMGLQPPRLTTGFTDRMYPNNRIYNQHGRIARTGGVFGYNGYDSRSNGRRWLAVDSKFKTRGRSNGFFGYGNENMDGLNERNRGPRAGGFKNQMGSAPITLVVKGQNILSNVNSKDKDNYIAIPDRKLYNREDFPEKYSHAKCFIIKSYSEDDVHKSIKYSVWASTPNGNKKLDAGYQEAQEKSGDCPVFLFFSVNTSGQFVGLAEMVGPVDFNKNVEYWQQDKWNGCFPVKWHIVKDVPNSLLKHITLENNDNKPVTNSRDTQEVKFEQGLQMLKIFKEHSSKTCILDDFGFYEAREITIQDKRSKQQQQQQFQKQVRDGKPTDMFDEETNGKLRLQKSLEVTSALLNEPAAIKVNREKEHSREKELIGRTRDAPKDNKSTIETENRVIANGDTNGC